MSDLGNKLIRPDVHDTRISKAKLKDGAVTVEKIETRGIDFEKKVRIHCTETPHEDLRLAFDGLEPTVRAILQLPDYWRAGEIAIQSVTWSKSDSTEVEGAVITGSVALETADAPFNFNTPHLPFEQYSKTGESPTMPVDGIDALETLRREVEAYLKGKRAQQSLEFGDAA